MSKQQMRYNESAHVLGKYEKRARAYSITNANVVDRAARRLFLIHEIVIALDVNNNREEQQNTEHEANKNK